MATPGKRTSEAGSSLAELVLVVPILLLAIMASVDLGRLVYLYQGVNDLVREAGNLVSRGTDPDAAYAALLAAEDALDLANQGGVIISRVRRRSTTSATPWVVEQYRYGALADAPSRVGSPGGPAALPQISSLEPGETITAVEVVHTFAPLFDLTGLGSLVFPDLVYESSFF